VRIGVAATPAIAIPTLEWLRESPHELARVITRPDQPSGRGRHINASAVAQWADQKNVPVIKPVAPTDMAASLADLDIVITIAYGVLLPIAIIELPKYGFINLHFSLLPQWRGAAPVPRAILNGDTQSGVTVFALDAGMDTGPIYIQKEVAIGARQNAGEVLQTMAAQGPEVIAQSLEMISRGVPPTSQPHNGATLAPKISKQEAHISWANPAELIDRHIRAFTPLPGAWTTLRGEKMTITSASVSDISLNAPVGTIVIESGSVFVACAHQSALRLEIVIPSGKKEMLAKSWMNGARLREGELFE